MLYPIFIIIIKVVFVAGFFKELRSSVNFTCSLENLPCLDQHEWWGPYHLKDHQDTSIRPFMIEFDDEMIQDLRYRLDYHRPYVPPLEGIRFEYGFHTGILEKLIRYWAEEYPFKERERFLNKYPMYKTNIQGLDIHFLWVRPKVRTTKEVIPVLMMHGWPGSVREFYEAIPLLTTLGNNRDFALELVMPSLPGYGYSDSAVRPGLGAGQAAVIMKNLMNRLGFKEFYVQGGDLGGITGMYMATIYPKVVLGFHTNWPFILHPTTRLMQVLGAIYPPLVVDPSLAYRMYPLVDILHFLISETGYLHEQATKPDTVGVPLTDSPAGLLAYNLEKFNTCLKSIHSQDYKLDSMPMDSLIDQVMMYWAPRSITTAMRFYAETFNMKHIGLGLDVLPCQVPTWSIQAHNEVAYDSPPLVRVKFPYLINDTAIPYGGHFLAFETPKVFAADVLDAIGAFRKIKKEGGLTKYHVQQDDWTIDLPHLVQVLINLYHHPDAWWFKPLLKFTFDALERIAERFFKYSGLSFVGLIGSYVKAFEASG